MHNPNNTDNDNTILFSDFWETTQTQLKNSLISSSLNRVAGDDADIPFADEYPPEDARLIKNLTQEMQKIKGMTNLIQKIGAQTDINKLNK